jgi:hypothetical protein
MKPILCVDFDGVVHAYTTPWSGPHTISDGPVPGAIEWLWKARDFFRVAIYSSRSKDASGIHAMRLWMREHSKPIFGPDHPMVIADNHVYPIDFVHEKPAAFLTIDDRAIQFDGIWDALDPAALLHFKPWNKK